MRLTPEQVDMVESPKSTTLQFALHFASLGMKVFPLKSGGKIPADKGWQEKATSSAGQITGWFEKSPNINYGIACGQSGLLVVDLDNKDGVDGIANWSTITSDIDLPETFAVDTPSGGIHLYFWGGDLRNSAGMIAEGVDLRGVGGYVVGPGSSISHGRYLPRLPWGLPDTHHIAASTEDLVNLLRSRKRKERPGSDGVLTPPGGAVSKPVSLALQRALGGAALRLFTAQTGSRNDQLNRASFEVGMNLGDDPQTEAVVSKVLSSFGREIGLDKTEITSTVQSGLTAGKSNRDPVGAEGSLFQALNLAQWFSEPHPAPEAFGSGGVLYRPSLTWVAGEPASGKSLLCMVWATDVIRSGGRVLWIDEEAGPNDTIGKFRSLGMTPELLQAGLEKHRQASCQGCHLGDPDMARGLRAWPPQGHLP